MLVVENFPRYNLGIMGRIKWTPALEDYVIEAICGGATLRKIGEEKGFSASCVVDHADNDPSFGKRYARALLIRGDLDLDEIEQLVGETPQKNRWGVDPGWANWQRTRIDAKKWLAAKRNPKKYGERIQTEISGPDGGAVKAEVKIEFVGGE